MIPLLARHWPFANGSGRLLDLYGRRIDLGAGERCAQTSDGFPMHVLADDLIGRHILLSGKFDRSVVQVLLDHARPGDTLLDVGANIGYVSAVFLAKVKNSRAICVEPQPGIVDLLRQNMAQFGDRADIREVGLSDADGVLRFSIDSANRGHSRVSDDGDREIPVVAAANLLESLDRLDLVKIDVEGWEEPVFRSMAKELKRLRPRAILLEDQTGSAAPGGKIGSALVGYRIFGIDKRLFATKMVRIHSAADCRFNDYIAIN